MNVIQSSNSDSTTRIQLLLSIGIIDQRTGSGTEERIRDPRIYENDRIDVAAQSRAYQRVRGGSGRMKRRVTDRRPANSDFPNSPVALSNFEIDSIPYVLNNANSNDSVITIFS